ncbi:hypothetical protein [Natronoglycomyces albus]|uniref:Uncharacterized protein n=1 Tax=Natronoglycomyces albus TaxID=2811108 RepID=A0A895XSL7_9ACTN|nr:hypothetical protein [Natronoglycomyces albus]QSB05260.1 hypothetical protein JQS30_16140 [Natronoglycomyces albus]
MSTPIYSTSTQTPEATGETGPQCGSSPESTTAQSGVELGSSIDAIDTAAAGQANSMGATGSTGTHRDAAMNSVQVAASKATGSASVTTTGAAASSQASSIGSRDVALIKTTGAQVVEFGFDSGVYMVSPHPDKGAALALSLQGVSLVIPVATISLARGRIADIAWESPFTARTEQWREALLDRVIAESAEAILGAAS